MLRQRLAILRISLGEHRKLLEEEGLGIVTGDHLRKETWGMIHRLVQQAREFAKESDVKVDYIHTLLAGMSWAWKKCGSRALGRGAGSAGFCKLFVEDVVLV